MASDEITWQILAHQHCSYKLKLPGHNGALRNSDKQTFCRNEYNLTGFCTRQSCPLANSKYATVRPDPESGALCLYIKTPERNHLPSRWWEKVTLPQNYEKALGVIDDKLMYWGKFYIHKCKQRLTRLTQVAIRERRIAKEEERLGEKIVPRIAAKVRRREETRERKAESAAKVERAIERELIDRLRSGAYGDRPLNVEEGVWKKVLRGLERAERPDEELEAESDEEDEREVEVEYVEGLEESDAEEMEDFDDWFDGESADEDESEVSGDEDDSDEGSSEGDEDEEDEEDQKPSAGAKRKRPAAPPSKTKPRKKGPKMEIEYEMETAPLREAQLAF